MSRSNKISNGKLSGSGHAVRWSDLLGSNSAMKVKIYATMQQLLHPSSFHLPMTHFKYTLKRGSFNLKTFCLHFINISFSIKLPIMPATTSLCISVKSDSADTEN
jgi:hypothetical protein